MSPNNNILLISGNQLRVPYPVYPIGLSYLATYIRKFLPQFNVEIFDFNLQSFDDLEDVLRRLQPAVVGISLRNVDNVNMLDKRNFISYYRSIVADVRKYSSSKIVMGGAGYSIFPEKLFEYLQPDFGVVGEGEQTLIKLLQALETGKDYCNIDGLVFRTDNGIKLNKRISYADSLQLEFEPRLIEYYWARGGMLNIQTKRGCPYTCDYCSYPLIEGKFTRDLDPGSVVENLRKMKADHSIDYVFFTDSVFNISNRYNVDLAEKIIASGVNVKWGAYFTPFNLSVEHLKLFKAAGLTHIEFGTDSLSEEMLRNFNKKFSVDDIIRASRDCAKMDVHFAHFLILGGYRETRATIAETMENALRLPPTVFFPAIGVRIYPGTQLYARAVAGGLVRSEEELMDSVYYVSDEITAEEIRSMAHATGRKWVFMDEDLGPAMNRMRAKGKKGPLWEYLAR